MQGKFDFDLAPRLWTIRWSHLNSFQNFENLTLFSLIFCNEIGSFDFNSFQTIALFFILGDLIKTFSKIWIIKLYFYYFFFTTLGDFNWIVSKIVKFTLYFHCFFAIILRDFTLIHLEISLFAHYLTLILKL